MVIKCRSCLTQKKVSNFYRSKRNNTGYEYICKECKRNKSSAHRYGVSEDFIKQLYKEHFCMCCESKLIPGRLTHIHHTPHGVQGLICYGCNYILGQEKDQDLLRIQLCLKYMGSQRKNLLSRGNQQGQTKRHITRRNVVRKPSETTNCETQICNQCNRLLTLDSFMKPKGRNRLRKCFDCSRHNLNLTQHKSLKPFKLQKQCDCCGEGFTKENKLCMHHVNDKVLGVVCNRCNQVLGDESEERRSQLLDCEMWIIDSQLEFKV